MEDHTGDIEGLAVLYFNSESGEKEKDKIEKLVASIFPKSTIIHGLKDLVSRIFEKNLENFFDLYIYTGKSESIIDVLNMFPRASEKQIPVPKLYLADKANEDDLKKLSTDGMTHIYPRIVSDLFMKYMLNSIGREAVLRKERDSYRLTSEKLKRKISNISDIYHKEMERMENKLKSKDTWFASMVHELRTPVNGVIGISHILSNTDLNKKQRQYLQKIENSSSLLLELVNDLLDYSKIEAGELVIEQIPFDINSVLENLSAIIGAKAEEKYLSLIFDISKDVPKNINGDPLRLSQVLMNLLNNAVKFTEDGEVILKISMHSRSGDDGVLMFEVIDTGIGMNSDQIKNLFRAFSQADNSTSRKYGGTGLGLSISKHLVELMGGEISVKSTENKGSVFAFTMPTKQLERRSYRLPSKDLMNKKVLIADSNPKSAQALNRMLSYFHFSTSIADSIHEADVFIETEDYDMVFIDERILKKISSSNRKSKVIMMKKGLTEEDEKVSYKLKVDDYLNKPFTQQMIFNIILDLYADGTTKLSHRSYENQKSILKKSSRKKILLAEDNPVNQAVILGLLEDTNIEVVVAPDGKEALEYLKNNIGISLILMDINMPKMNGYEATKKIRELNSYRNTPVLAITADYIPSEELEAGGIQGYLSKPIDVNSFYTILIKYLHIDEEVEKERAVEQQDLVPANTEESQEDLEEEAPFRLPGFNVSKGLERAGGNEELYANLVVNFYKMFKNASEEIRRLLLKGEYEEANRIANHLTDSAANISADRVYRISKQLVIFIENWKTEQSLDLCNKLEYAISDIEEGIENIYKEKPSLKEKSGKNDIRENFSVGSGEDDALEIVAAEDRSAKNGSTDIEKRRGNVQKASLNEDHLDISQKDESPEETLAGGEKNDEWRSILSGLESAIKSKRSFLCSSLIKNLRTVQPLEKSKTLADKLSKLLVDRNFRDMMKIVEEVRSQNR